MKLHGTKTEFFRQFIPNDCTKLLKLGAEHTGIQVIVPGNILLVPYCPE